jgi:Ca2+-binding RTX toxin-like protein
MNMGLPRIRGNDDPETLTGTNIAEEIRGEGGDDILSGLGGNDRLRGDKGNDTLDGGEGNDRLRGDHGDDMLTGGTGFDRFKFDFQGGHDTVTDFTEGEDKLDFTNFGFDSVATLLSKAAQVDGDVVFTLYGGEMITLQNVSLANPGDGDFRI